MALGWLALDAMALCVAGVGSCGTYGTGLALVVRLDPPSLTHHLCNTPSFTHHLSHTIFYTQLCHTPSLTPTIFHTPLCHTPLCLTPSFTTPSFTHHFVTHHLSPHHLSHTIFHHTSFHTQRRHTPALTHFLSHATMSHTIFHTPLCHPPSFTHHFVTNHLSHTTLSHTIFHTPLCHPSSFTHNFVTHHLSPHHLSHTHSFVTHHLSPHHLSHHFVQHHFLHTTLSRAPFHAQLCHTHTHTIFLCHTPSFTYNFVTHNFVFLLDPPQPPLSFLLSPSPLQNLVLIIGRSCLVGSPGRLMNFFKTTCGIIFPNDLPILGTGSRQKLLKPLITDQVTAAWCCRKQFLLTFTCLYLHMRRTPMRTTCAKNRRMQYAAYVFDVRMNIAYASYVTCVIIWVHSHHIKQVYSPT